MSNDSNLGHLIIAQVGKWLRKEGPAKRSYLSDFDRISNEVRPGDVLLVEGHSRISSIIRMITQSPWTHSALYIGRLHDIEDEQLRDIVQQHCDCSPSHQLVIESLIGKGTVVSPLDKYRYDHVRICRPIGLLRADAQKVIAYAIGRFGAIYSLRHLLDLARFIFPWSILPRRWRSSLFAHNALQPTEDICSSMIAEAFTSINFPILPLIVVDPQNKTWELVHRNPKLFTPSDFDYSPYFSIIKYPILPLSEFGTYHNLPWRKDLLSDDAGILVQIPEIPKERATLPNPQQNTKKN